MIWKWTEIVNCRQCKQQLIVYMGECMLIHVVPLLSNDQKFLVAGSGDGADRDGVWCVKGDGIEYKEHVQSSTQATFWERGV